MRLLASAQHIAVRPVTADGSLLAVYEVSPYGAPTVLCFVRRYQAYEMLVSLFDSLEGTPDEQQSTTETPYWLLRR